MDRTPLTVDEIRRMSEEICTKLEETFSRMKKLINELIVYNSNSEPYVAKLESAKRKEHGVLEEKDKKLNDFVEPVEEKDNGKNVGRDDLQELFRSKIRESKFDKLKALMDEKAYGKLIEIPQDKIAEMYEEISKL